MPCCVQPPNRKNWKTNWKKSSNHQIYKKRNKRRRKVINFWSSLSTKSKQQSRLTKMTIQHYQNQKKKISVNVKRKIITSSVNVKREKSLPLWIWIFWDANHIFSRKDWIQIFTNFLTNQKLDCFCANIKQGQNRCGWLKNSWKLGIHFSWKHVVNSSIECFLSEWTKKKLYS